MDDVLAGVRAGDLSGLAALPLSGVLGPVEVVAEDEEEAAAGPLHVLEPGLGLGGGWGGQHYEVSCSG